MSEPIRRKIGVCLEKFCQMCTSRQEFMPDSCPFQILQALDNGMGLGDSGWQPRQSGKTKKLMTLANQLATAGYPVIYLVPNTCMAQHAKHRVVPEVKTMSFHQVKDHGYLRGMKPSVVISDELKPEQLEQLRDALRFHQVVAAYWS